MTQTEPDLPRSEPAVSRRERDILRTFRGAGATRTRREANTQAKLEGELSLAGEELERTRQEAEAKKTTQEADSLQRRQSERQSADALLAQIHADADAKLRQSESSVQGYYQGQRHSAEAAIKQITDAAQARLDSETGQATKQHQAAQNTSLSYFEQGKQQAAAHLAAVESALAHAQTQLSATKFASLLPQRIAPLQPQHPAYQAQNPLAALAANEQAATSAAQEIDRALVDLSSWQKVRNRLIIAIVVLWAIAAGLILVALFVLKR